MTTPVLAMPATPRQFALVLDEEDEAYADFVEWRRPADPVIWWGAELDGEVLLYRACDDGRLDTARHASPDAALSRWERVYPVKLVWL